MEFKVGDEITFDGSIDKTKDVTYSGIRTDKEINPHFPNDKHIARLLVANPYSHFRVSEVNEPYYICDKIWESGDEEIPVLAVGVFIHKDEAIPYDKSYNGTVINKRKR